MSDIERIKKVVDSDRMGVVIGSENAIKTDLNRVIKEYFNLIDSKLFIEKEGETYNIRYECKGSHIKAFNIIKN